MIRICSHTFVILCILFSFVHSACSSEKKPSGKESPIPPENAYSISRHGITWYFDREYPTGTFANGDPWVVGPVTIIFIDPPSIKEGNGRIINGSMLNPEPEHIQGYDSQAFGGGERGWYDPALNRARPDDTVLSADNPLIISQNASLVSCISIPALHNGYHNQLDTMAVLTILSEAPPAGSFRPGYAGSAKALNATVADMDSHWSLLKQLTPVASAPDIAEVAARMEKPWVDHWPNYMGEVFHPSGNMPLYGRELASVVSDAALMVHLDIDDALKRPLVIRLIQLGIDNYSVTQCAGGRTAFRADGGHMSGRAWPIIFAGLMLGDTVMRDICAKSGAYAYQNGYDAGDLPPDYLHFGELDQTFFVTQSDIDREHTDHDTRSAYIPYVTADLGAAEWGINHAWNPEADNANWNAIYRDVCGIGWSGYVLASRIMNAAAHWNHPPLIAYMDRYMQRMTGDEERTYNDFQEAMWDTYRADY